jgi:hypothetical protein
LVLLLLLRWRVVLCLAWWRVVALLGVGRRRRVVLLLFGVLGYAWDCELCVIVTLTGWRSWIDSEQSVRLQSHS